VKTVEPGAVLRGALAGLFLLVPLSALRAVVDRETGDFDGSGWVLVFGLAVLLAYVVAGAVAAYRAPATPLSNGTLAGLGAFVLWVPLRGLIWVARSESRGLFTGPEPVFTVGQIFGQLVFAAAFGLIGGFIGARMARSARVRNGDGAGTAIPPRG
jgi:hypothetical protein